MNRDLSSGLALLNLRVKQGVRTGMLRAALALHQASENEEPKPPHDYGTLRASASVFVDDKLEYVSDLPVEAGSAQPLTMLLPRRRQALCGDGVFQHALCGESA